MRPTHHKKKSTARTRPSRHDGFTLTELMIVIVMIAALAALMFPLIGHMRTKAQSVESVNRIRQCGIILLQKASENNNFLQVHTAGSSSSMHDLRLHGMVLDAVGKETVAKLVYTPAYEKKASGTWPVWGVNADDDPDSGIVWERVWVTRGGQQRYLEGLRLAKCDRTDRYPLLADSSNSGGAPRARFTNDGQYKFGMRYAGKGPIFFLDASTRLVGKEDMGRYGITQAYLFDNGSNSNPTLVSANVTQ